MSETLTYVKFLVLKKSSQLQNTIKKSKDCSKTNTENFSSSYLFPSTSNQSKNEGMPASLFNPGQQTFNSPTTPKNFAESANVEVCQSNHPVSHFNSSDPESLVKEKEIYKNLDRILEDKIRKIVFREGSKKFTLAMTNIYQFHFENKPESKKAFLHRKEFQDLFRYEILESQEERNHRTLLRNLMEFYYDLNQEGTWDTNLVANVRKMIKLEATHRHVGKLFFLKSGMHLGCFKEKCFQHVAEKIKLLLKNSRRYLNENIKKNISLFDGFLYGVRPLLLQELIKPIENKRIINTYVSPHAADQLAKILLIFFLDKEKELGKLSESMLKKMFARASARFYLETEMYLIDRKPKYLAWVNPPRTGPLQNTLLSTVINFSHYVERFQPYAAHFIWKHQLSFDSELIAYANRSKYEGFFQTLRQAAQLAAFPNANEAPIQDVIHFLESTSKPLPQKKSSFWAIF